MWDKVTLCYIFPTSFSLVYLASECTPSQQTESNNTFNILELMPQLPYTVTLQCIK